MRRALKSEHAGVFSIFPKNNSHFHCLFLCLEEDIFLRGITVVYKVGWGLKKKGAFALHIRSLPLLSVGGCVQSLKTSACSAQLCACPTRDTEMCGSYWQMRSKYRIDEAKWALRWLILFL